MSPLWISTIRCSWPNASKTPASKSPAPDWAITPVRRPDLPSAKNIASPDKSIRWVQGSNHGFVPKNSEVIVWSTGKNAVKK